MYTSIIVVGRLAHLVTCDNCAPDHHPADDEERVRREQLAEVDPLRGQAHREDHRVLPAVE